MAPPYISMISFTISMITVMVLITIMIVFLLVRVTKRTPR